MSHNIVNVDPRGASGGILELISFLGLVHPRRVVIENGGGSLREVLGWLGFLNGLALTRQGDLVQVALGDLSCGILSIRVIKLNVGIVWQRVIWK